MQITVRPVANSAQHNWQVCLDQHAISFRTEAEAQHFVATLQARLQAPHQLPQKLAS